MLLKLCFFKENNAKPNKNIPILRKKTTTNGGKPFKNQNKNIFAFV